MSAREKGIFLGSMIYPNTDSFCHETVYEINSALYQSLPYGKSRVNGVVVENEELSLWCDGSKTLTKKGGRSVGRIRGVSMSDTCDDDDTGICIN